MSAQEQQNAPMEAESWSNPTDHFKLRHKFITLYTDKEFNIMKWLEFKSSALGKWFVPWWSPMYFVGTHLSQRTRNLWLVENHLNYRPYWGRRNDEDSTY